MIKKKYFLLLSMLLLIVLLGFSGTCYARELTQTEIKNFMLNYLDYYYIKGDTTYNFYKNQIINADLSGWENGIKGKQGLYLLQAYKADNSQLDFYYFCWRDTNNNKAFMSKLNGADTITTKDLTITFKNHFNVNTGVINFEQAQISIFKNREWDYFDGNIYESSNSNVVAISANSFYPTTLNNSVFESQYVPTPVSYFDIDINADFRDNKATISNDTSGIEYYLIPYNSNKIRIGNMFNYSNLAGVVKRKFRYKQATRSFDLFQEYQANTNNLEFFDVADDTLIVFEYYQPDTTEFITFIPKADTGFSQFTVPIYYTSANTSIVNGVIDTGDTFSGDNYNNYNNDTNTDKVINNINNDSEIEESLNQFISGDAEDIADKFGFRHYGLEFYDFIYRTITSIVDVLTAEGDVYFDYSMHGETPTRIYASSFTTPNGVLKTFLVMFLISCTIFVFYKNIADLFELLSTGNFYEVLDQLKVDRNIFKM